MSRLNFPTIPIQDGVAIPTLRSLRRLCGNELCCDDWGCGDCALYSDKNLYKWLLQEADPEEIDL